MTPRKLKKLPFSIVLVAIMATNTFSQEKNIDSLIYDLEQKISISNSKKENGDLHLNIAELYRDSNKSDFAFKNFTKALQNFEDENLTSKAMDVNLQIFSLLDSQNELKTNPLPYLDKYFQFAKKNNDSERLLKANLQYASYYFNSKGYRTSKKYYSKALIQAKTLKDTIKVANINSNLGLLYSGFINQDSARIYFNKALKLYKKENITELFSTYLNYANSYEREEKYKDAIEVLHKLKNIKPTKYKDNLNKIYYYKLSKCYQETGDYKRALDFLSKYNNLKDSINVTSQNIAISNIKEQYDNEKLRADNLESEVKRKQNKNLLFGSLGLLLFGSITFLLIQKNTKRKQRIAEQEKELQVQKVGTLMKEQELASIDAMIEGQEKERQRIANDLHDDLGGMMATVKLHFNTLKDKPSADLYNKTDKLLDEAYQKVRSIAHAKNSGVIAKHGLLKSVNNMAQKVSSTGKIQIDVIDHGLEDRLENSLELTIFRIIQELITNVIKHANASEATIHLTQHDDSLNIMVEDNGKGFNPKNIKKDQGMGISSIDKRVDHLNGSLEIESEKGQGTTIIIDIPI